MPHGFFTDPDDLEKLARARAALSRNHGVFRALEARALDAGNPETFARRAIVALDEAVHRHPGVLVSSKLEQRLVQVGRDALTGKVERRQRSTAASRVLHVLTTAYESGGHTRVAERWIRADRGRVSSVLLTGRTASRHLPTGLAAAARASGGTVIGLKGGDLLTRAEHMREISNRHDLLVLHIHMHDVVPVIALADPGGRPPTILFNHANHTFWVGVGVADVVASLQEVDAVNACTRRGVPPEASVILPIPVNTRELPTRQEARRQLGLADGPLVLAVGPEYKMRGILTPHFTQVAASLVDASVGARLIVIGPDASGEWADLESASAGRARAIGVQPNPVVNLYMSAADVLLDTWPVTGGATLIDAGYSRLPVVSIGDGRRELAVVRPESEALGGAIILASDFDSVQGAVVGLLADPGRREALGNRSHDFVDEHHGRGWVAYMEKAVEAAFARAGCATPPLREPAPQYTDWECLLYLAYAGEAGNPAVARVRESYRRLHRQVLDETARRLDRFL